MTTWKLCIVTLLLAVTLLSASVDPELKQCRHQCRHQEGLREDQRLKCQERCDEYAKRREFGREEPERTEKSPYIFQDEHFDTVVRTEEGRVHVLNKFTEISHLLKGIHNYRIGFVEANPLAFIAPVHFDADTIYFVAKGKATVTLLRKENKETFNIERGDVLFIPAGTPVYTANRDQREKLFIVKLFSPVSLPGHFEPFYASGGENQETFFKAFSWKVLGAAFKREREEIERLFGQQKKGSIRKATREQVEELGRQAESGGGAGGVWPFHGDSKGPFNLFKRTVHSNRYGTLFEAKFEQLQDLDLIISFANITKGSMAGPYFNSKATKIAFVVKGEGFIEMACPHISSEQKGFGFERVSGEVREGTVFVTPAGHPLTAIASPNSELQVLCFEVFAKGNVKYTLAGKNNIVSQMDSVAKELSFGVPAREVDRIFGAQDQDFFFPGPTQRGRIAYI